MVQIILWLIVICPNVTETFDAERKKNGRKVQKPAPAPIFISKKLSAKITFSYIAHTAFPIATFHDERIVSV